MAVFLKEAVPGGEIGLRGGCFFFDFLGAPRLGLDDMIGLVLNVFGTSL